MRGAPGICASPLVLPVEVPVAVPAPLVVVVVAVLPWPVVAPTPPLELALLVPATVEAVVLDPAAVAVEVLEPLAVPPPDVEHPQRPIAIATACIRIGALSFGTSQSAFGSRPDARFARE
jgi:hypothetical protein